MNTKHLDYFIALHECRNYSAAAAQVGVTQSVLYRYLQNLEGQLGIELFDRHKGELLLNEAGRIYLNGVLHVKSLYKHMCTAALAQTDTSKLSLRIGITKEKRDKLLYHLYPELMDYFPSLQITVTEGTPQELYALLTEGQIQCIYSFYNNELYPDTRHAMVGSAELLLLLPQEIAQGLATKDVDEQGIPRLAAFPTEILQSLPIVCHDAGTCIGMKIDALARQYDFGLDSAQRFDRDELIYAYLRTGKYAGFLPEGDVSAERKYRAFRLPRPSYLKNGLVFLKDYRPIRVDRYLYRLLCDLTFHIYPHCYRMNSLGQELYAFLEEEKTNGHQDL